MVFKTKYACEEAHTTLSREEGTQCGGVSKILLPARVSGAPGTQDIGTGAELCHGS